MRSRLVKNMEGKYEWVPIEQVSTFKSNRKMPACGEDLTVDGYINKYGGIKSIIDHSIHTTKASYENHLKANGKIIMDW